MLYDPSHHTPPPQAVESVLEHRDNEILRQDA